MLNTASKMLTVALVLETTLTLQPPLAFGASFEPQRYTHGIVASDHPEASAAGQRMLAKGGNAFDAAIATSLALAVVRPQSTGIGGGGFMVFHHQNKTGVLDYREVAPAQATANMYLDEKGIPVPELSTVGFKAAGVPGLLAGLHEVYKTKATLPLKELVAPAIALAEAGFLADSHFVHASEILNERGARADLKALYFINQKPAKQGQRVQNKPLAASLRLLSEQGFRAMYEGPWAESFAGKIQAAGGLISAADLKAYQPTYRTPLTTDYRGYKVATMPPPSSGGVALITMLNILKPYPLDWNALSWGSSEYTHLLTESMKHAFSDRAHFLGDPAFVDVPVKELTSERYAEQLLTRINQAEYATLNSTFYGKKGLEKKANQTPILDHGTTHYAIMDQAGNMVSATETINTYFGSQAVVPGTGILLNNEMDDFSKAPGVPNAFGLVGTEANAIAPYKKPLSSMTPTLVFTKENKPFLALGASGGPRIITGTFLSLVNVIDYGMNVNEAVSAPRFHHQWKPDILFVEKEIPRDVQRVLVSKGHQLMMGNAENVVQAVMFDQGYFTGASDPRKGGSPAGYSK
jgi:gamma-glutamyltranspeptidase / glutathione hydrolase